MHMNLYVRLNNENQTLYEGSLLQGLVRRHRTLALLVNQVRLFFDSMISPEH